MAEARTTSTPPARRGWRGAAPPEGPRHRWEQAGAGSVRHALASRSLRKFRVAGWFIAAGVLLLLLGWYLLYSPAQTAFFTIAGTEHRRPIPPNAWALEDTLALRDLSAKTLQVADLSEDWRSQEQGLKRLDQELATFVRRHNRAPAIVLYVSLPGAVDGQGRPCLLTPDAAPHDSSTWLPLARVFDALRSAGVPARVHKLLVLDSVREIADWNLAQACNSFVDSLPAAVAEASIPNLAILTSSGPGQAAAATPALGGSVFGHYLRLGLAGAADSPGFGGNGNRRVSLVELTQYLQGHVHGWTAHHLGRAQTPQTIPDSANFDVAWSLNARDLRDMLERAQRAQAADPAVAEGEIARLWSQLDSLRTARPWRYDPLGWRSLALDLVRLEQLASAGQAYAAEAGQLHGELANRLAAAQLRHQAAQRGGSLPAYAAILDGAAVVELKTHSLPLAALWGTADADALRGLAAECRRFGDSPSTANLASALLAFDAANLPAAFDEANLLAVWQRLAVPSAWRDAAPLTLAWQVHTLAQQHAAPPALDGLPGDERAHAFVRSHLVPLDEARRELEDAVLVGPARTGSLAAGEDMAQRLASFTIGRRAAEVFALRDDVWAELPQLAAWLCRPQPSVEEAEAADRQIEQVLQPLLADAIRLEQELLRAEQGRGGDLAWTADALAESVQANFTRLRAEFDEHARSLTTATDSAAAVREIDAVLALPLVSWDLRQRLREKRHELHLKRAASYDAIHDGAALPGGSAPAASHLDRVLRWRPHPLAAIVDHALVLQPAGERASAADRGDSLAAVAALNESVRQRLAALSQGPAKSLVSGQATQAAPDLKSLCQAESRLRTAAGLWFDPPAVDPVRELRRADLAQVFLWQSQRALDDFYGPAKNGEPFFATAAADYLAAARSFGPLTPTADGQAAELSRQLSQRRIAASEALGVSATDILLVDQSASVDSSLDVRARTPEAIAALPPATAAVFLADQSGRVGPPGWPLALPPADAQARQALLLQKLSLETAGLKSRGPLVQAVASIRGNDFAAPLLLRAPGGLRVEFEPPVYGPPQVTVLGFERKKASVVFILDCSHSMQAAVAVERPGAAARQESTRMEVAKGALRSLLAELAARGDLRVGVRLFGHRVGWSTTEADKLLRQTTYADEIPAELRPYEDVQEVLDLGRFDSIAAGRVFDKLQTVRPWGESPIFLALQQAVADFGPEDNSARSIVLITDGQNSQFNPPRELAPALADVQAAAERAGVAIHVVGFDIQQGEAEAAGRDFQELAGRSGGSFTAAKDATALIETLQTFMRPGQFRVADAAGNAVGQAEIGRTVTLSNQRGPKSYGVSFENLREPVELFGGEAVELTIRRGQPRLEVVPYLKGNPQPQSLIAEADGTPSPLATWLHRSVRTQEGIKFPISIQHADGHFVPRPLELWVEILPLGLPPQADAGAYIFYDAAYEPGTSVPLAALLCRDWPAAATRAEVRVWIKSTPTEPLESRPLVEVADRLPAEGSGYTIPGMSGVAYQVRTVGGGGQSLSVGVIERHDERSPGVGSLKVSLSPAPSRAVHQFDAANRLVLHTFNYDQPADDLRGRIAIQFTPREAAQAQSWRTAQPAIVDVSDRMDLLELSPAAGGSPQ